MSDQPSRATSTAQADIFIARNGQTHGPYPRHVIENWIYSGKIYRHDLACTHKTSWQPVAKLLWPEAVDDMPMCSRCGKKAEGFFKSPVNVDSTGLCTVCRGEWAKDLNKFLIYFREFATKGLPIEKDWATLETLVDKRDLKQSVPYLREDLRLLIQKSLDTRSRDYTFTEDQQSDFEDLVKLLSLPEYCFEEVRGILNVGLQNIAIPCARCGAGVVLRAYESSFACVACGRKAVLRICPRCSIPFELEQERSDKRIKCPSCHLDSSAITAKDLAKTLQQDQTVIADPSRRIVTGIQLGGSGLGAPVGANCRLDFTSNRISIDVVSQQNKYETVGSVEYANVTSFQLGGRGAITTGGGWVGGGFGLKGIIEGVLLSTALNAITTRSRIETIVYFGTTAGEMILFNNRETPEILRILLSPAISRIEAAQRESAALAHRESAAPRPAMSDELAKLGELRAKGTISADEFQRIKSAMIESVVRGNGAH